MPTKVLVHKSGHVEAYLTTEHAAVSGGQPVLVVEGRAYGPGDILPNGLSASELVRKFQARSDPEGGRWGKRTAEALAAAALFTDVTGD